MEDFELSEVATILDMPKSKVKNWTIGRPITIKPSAKVARGTGSRNRYTREDILLLAVAEQILGIGFEGSEAQQFLERLKPDVGKFGTDIETILIYQEKGKRRWLQVKNQRDHFMLAKAWFGRKKIMGMYWLNVLRLTEQVDRKIREVVEGGAQ